MKTGQLVCDRRTYAESPYHHVHEFAQLVIPIQGALSIAIENNFYRGEEPQVLFVPPRTVHSFHSAAGNRFFVFDIPQEILATDRVEYGLCCRLDARWQAIRTLLFAEVGDGERAAGRRICELFRYVLRLLEKPEASPSIAYIRENFHRPLTIKELADMEHYHDSYYYEWFYKQTGMTPMSYIRQLRLERAKLLLAETGYSLLQIALQVGYANQATLSRLFMQYEGILPRNYRKSIRGRDKK